MFSLGLHRSLVLALERLAHFLPLLGLEARYEFVLTATVQFLVDDHSEALSALFQIICRALLPHLYLLALDARLKSRLFAVEELVLLLRHLVLFFGELALPLSNLLDRLLNVKIVLYRFATSS